MAGDNTPVASTTSAAGSTAAPWLRYEWHTPIAILGGVVAPLAGLASGWLKVALVIAGIVLVAIAAAGAAINRKRVSTLEDRIVELEGKVSDVETERNDALAERDSAQDDLTTVAQVSKSVYRSLLTNIADQLQLTARERISIYLHDAGLPSFQLLSRHSPDPSLEEAPGRRVYPDNMGIIGKAWRDGYAEESELTDASVGGAKYVAENYEKYALPTGVTEGLAMKSCRLVALRYPGGGTGDTFIGVLVVESIDDSWDTSGVRDALVNSEWWYTLQEHLGARRHQLPVLSNAERRGF